MPKIAREHASQSISMEGFEGRYQDLGGYTVGFETYTEDADPDEVASLFRGLPDDRCQCPHWGLVVTGKLAYRYADGTEDVIEAGEAYYAPPGHLPVFFVGTEIVEISPTDDLRRTVDVVMANLRAAGVS